MNEEIIKISFKIIGYSGDAKGKAFEAISEAKKGNIESAREKLKESKEIISNAHNYQTEMIRKEARGEKSETGIIIIHAQDHLMNTINYQTLAGEIIDLYDRIEKLENK